MARVSMQSFSNKHSPEMYSSTPSLACCKEHTPNNSSYVFWNAFHFWIFHFWNVLHISFFHSFLRTKEKPPIASIDANAHDPAWDLSKNGTKKIGFKPLPALPCTSMERIQERQHRLMQNTILGRRMRRIKARYRPLMKNSTQRICGPTWKTSL